LRRPAAAYQRAAVKRRHRRKPAVLAVLLAGARAAGRLSRLRRQPAETDRASVHREGLYEAAVLAVAPRCDQDRDPLSGFGHAALVARAIEMDSGPLIDMFRHYYPERFPSLWQ